jgi:hypothetical protein
MSAQQERTGPLFSDVLTAEWISRTHPLRPMRPLTHEALYRQKPTVCRLDPASDRPSILLEGLIIALLL